MPLLCTGPRLWGLCICQGLRQLALSLRAALFLVGEHGNFGHFFLQFRGVRWTSWQVYYRRKGQKSLLYGTTVDSSTSVLVIARGKRLRARKINRKFVVSNKRSFIDCVVQTHHHPDGTTLIPLRSYILLPARSVCVIFVLPSQRLKPFIPILSVPFYYYNANYVDKYETFYVDTIATPFCTLFH